MIISFSNKNYNCIISMILGLSILALTILMMNGFIANNSLYFLPFFFLIVSSLIFKSHFSLLIYVALFFLSYLFAWGVLYQAGKSPDINTSFAFVAYFIAIASSSIFVLDNLLYRFKN